LDAENLTTITSDITGSSANKDRVTVAPYLIVIKNHRDKEAFAKIKYWIRECDNIRPLLPSLQYFDSKISEAIIKALAKRIPPITMSNLKHKYPSWFENLKIVETVP